MEEDAEPEVMDAGLIVGCQKAEHYEIAGYGSAVTFAKLLGNQEAARLLAQSLNEEELADKKLTEIAETTINVEAADSSDDAEEATTRSSSRSNGGGRKSSSSSRRSSR
jgi:ferritin-like metal-binding protein YciE